MTIERKAQANWKGDLKTGSGSLKLESNAYQGPYSFKGRTAEKSSETNPEELIGAALASCFSMQLSALLSKEGHIPEQIDTTAKVYFNLDPNGAYISKIHLETKVKAPGISRDLFQQQAEKAKTICPISKALKAVNIELSSELL